jgi:hypothetical protein
MNRIRTSCCLIAVAGVGLGVHAAQVAAFAQPEGVRPAVSLRDAGTPDAGQISTELFSDRTVFDMPLPGPDHPPLHEIPPMPMPTPEMDVDSPLPVGRHWADVQGGMTFYDSSTGEWYEMPVRMPTGAAGGESAEGDYWGVVDHDPSQEFGRGFGTMSLASELSTWPRSGNVKLAMRFTDQNGIVRWFSCSGSMQDPGVVLTAAHCVYARSPNVFGTNINIFSFADIIYVYPAWDGNGNAFPPGSTAVHQNFGYASGTAFLAGTNYINDGNFDADAGLIRITRGGSRNVGMLTGWFAWAWGGTCSTIQGRTYNNFSYPAENCPTAGLHNGRDMYYWSGSIDSCPDNQLQLDTTAGCLTAVWGGMSGSGMYYVSDDNRYIHAVCSNSNRSTRGRYTKLWETFVNDMVTFENNTRTNSEDWEPLMLRARGSTTVQAGTQMNDSLDVKMINATNASPPVRNYTMRVYLSTNNTITSADTLLATWTWNNRDFDAMANVNFNIPAPNIPIDTPAGNYWLGVIIDSGLPGTTANDATNSWDAQPITVTPRPDLVATFCNAPSGSFYRGTNINVFHHTSNIGELGTTGTTVQFRASTNNIISTFDTLMQSNNFAGISAGGVLQTATSVQIPPTLPPGTYFIGTMVSEPSGNEVTTSNNWVSDTNTITVLACAADLAAPWGVLNFFDLSAYLAAYNAQQPSADLASPFGTFNFFDISAYLNLFNAGCP